MTTITGLAELNEYEGKDLGTSDWHEVTQDDINAFADVNMKYLSESGYLPGLPAHFFSKLEAGSPSVLTCTV